MRRVLLVLLAVVVLAVAAGAQLADAKPPASSVSILGVQALTRSKPLVSGHVNVVPVRLPFGFAISMRNKSQDGRVVVIKIRVRFQRSDQPTIGLRATAFLGPGRTAIAHIVAKRRIPFAQRGRLTLSVSDHARHTTTVRHYAVIFSLG
jgi:hypothetical protein